MPAWLVSLHSTHQQQRAVSKAHVKLGRLARAAVDDDTFEARLEQRCHACRRQSHARLALVRLLGHSDGQPIIADALGAAAACRAAVSRLPALAAQDPAAVRASKLAALAADGKQRKQGRAHAAGC